MRVGIGYDAHALVVGRMLRLGGVNIPFEKGLAGHSDADVLIHAIMDALLGAAGLRDIGHYFPPGDSAYKDISSIKMLTEVGKLLQKGNYTIINIDSTVIAEKPKLASYIDEMRSRIAGALSIAIDQVMVKATTTEGLGFTGSGQGIAAHAIVSIKQITM